MRMFLIGMTRKHRQHKHLLHSILRMPVNTQGGKGCKKGKNGKDDGQNVLMIECKENEGQMFGRVIKVEGDRRFRIFCNDSKERICKLAGRIRRGDRVERGGVVLISIRELSSARAGSSDSDVGDIIANVDPSLYGKMKKMDGINPLLFINLENEDKASIRKRVQRLEEGQGEDDLFDLGGEASDSDESDDLETADAKAERMKELDEKKKKEELERAAKRNVKYMDNGDLDVDDI
jgi:initiation factor 1A